MTVYQATITQLPLSADDGVPGYHHPSYHRPLMTVYRATITQLPSSAGDGVPGYNHPVTVVRW